MSWTLDVPATLSNLGSGFDVLGVALELHNRFCFTPTGEAGALTEGGAPLDPATHAVAGTVRAAEAAFGVRLPVGLALEQTERVPRSRGLGSSATARVAGYLAWCRFTGHTPPLEEGLALLSELEGHPDNVAAAMLGGVTLAVGGTPFVWRRLEPPAGLRVVVCVPELQVSTAAARAVLPASYPRAELVYNARRLALLMTGLLAGDAEALRLGVEDHVHTPYRKGLIGPVDEVIAGAMGAGASCAFISGSGSTLAALVLDPAADGAAIGRAMEAPLRAAGIGCWSGVLRPGLVGAVERKM
jgi:homoserine kinase